MRMRVTMTSGGKINLPWNYPHYLHGFLYASMLKIEPKLAEFLHNEGFRVEGHIYKLFNFSWLHPKKAQKEKEALSMLPPILWWISSPLAPVIETLAKFMLQENIIKVKDTILEIERIEIEETPKLEGKCLFKTLSPIVISTGKRVKGKLEHEYLSPSDERFWQIAKTNLLRKAKALNVEVNDESLSFYPEGEWKSKLIEVQKTKIRAFDGSFWAEGNPKLLWIAYECGLGARNAQGFGMLKLLKQAH